MVRLKQEYQRQMLADRKYRTLKSELDAAKQRLLDSHGLNGSTVKVLKKQVSRLMKEMEQLKEAIRTGEYEL